MRGGSDEGAATGAAATVVIRAYNEAPALGAVLEAVLAQDGGPVEVLVIDSGSTDGTLDVARRFPVRVHELPPEIFTYGGALNLGAQLATTPVCVHLSAHCRPLDRRWLARLLAPLADAEVVATYGRQRPVPGVNPYEALDLERIFPPGPLPAGARRYFSNANCAIRRPVLLRHPFDDTIAIMEDALWLLELPPPWRVVYVPEAAVAHSHPLRWRYWFQRYERDGMAYRHIGARCGVELVPERALRPWPRLRGLAVDAWRTTGALARQGHWRHLAGYPAFCLLREVALRRGLRRAAGLDLPAPGPAASPAAAAWRPRPAAGPAIAAVVLNYRTPANSLAAVASLAASARPLQALILVDNGSGDGSPEWLRRAAPAAVVVETGANLGFAGGVNVGIREALRDGADLVLLVNSDATLTADALGRLERALAETPGAGIAGPLLGAGADGDVIASRGIAFAPGSGRMRHPGHGGLRSALTAGVRVVDAVSGAVMLIRRPVLEAVGCFEEAYFFSFEDVDFCLRARAAGFTTLCVETAVADHAGSRSISLRSPRRLYFATRNHLLLASRRAPLASRSRRLARGVFILGLNLAHALITAEVPRLAGAGAVLRGGWHHIVGRYGDGS